MIGGIEWVYDDGGRAQAGFQGETRDCVTRAIAIASGRDYRMVYDELHQATLQSKAAMRRLGLMYKQNARKQASPRNGVLPTVYKPYLAEHGWIWTPTMQIGSNDRLHLRTGVLPDGVFIVRLSKHITTLVDGVLHDTHDCSWSGQRLIYGHWHRPD